MDKKHRDSSTQDICKGMLHDRGKATKNIITLSPRNEKYRKRNFSNHKRPVQVTCSASILKASNHCVKVVDQKFTTKDQKDVNKVIVKGTPKDDPQSNLISLNILDSEFGNFSSVSSQISRIWKLTQISQVIQIQFQFLILMLIYFHILLTAGLFIYSCNSSNFLDSFLSLDKIK